MSSNTHDETEWERRRERIATAVLGHYLAAQVDGEFLYGTKEAVERAVLAADLLLEELETE